MKSLSPVVWSEGMHLAQHHFQAQSRYFEALTSFGIETLFFRPYGVVASELDAEALLNGTVALTHARGVMPDGLTFHFPSDPTPAPLAIRETFSPTRESHLVLLAIPPYHADRANHLPEDGAAVRTDSAGESSAARDGARYRAGVRTIPDETTGRDEKPVAIALKNFRLILDVEATEGLVTLPLARVRRDGSGHFIYDPEYIPPLLRIGASPHLMTIVERLVGIMDAKAEALRAERRGVYGTRPEYASREVVSFWLSHAIHSQLVPLRHHLRTASAHPELLFNELSRLAGALCTFSLHAHPRDLPLYDHDHLDHCFTALDQQIRNHLELVVPEDFLSFQLHLGEENVYSVAVPDTRAFRRTRWFLAVRAGTEPPGIVATQVPRLVKVCSALHIARLVRSAYPGLPLEHVPIPPAEIAPRADTQYFAVAQAGPCWQSVMDTREVGVYLPEAIPAAELELVILPEG